MTRKRDGEVATVVQPAKGKGKSKGGGRGKGKKDNRRWRSTSVGENDIHEEARVSRGGELGKTKESGKGNGEGGNNKRPRNRGGRGPKGGGPRSESRRDNREKQQEQEHQEEEASSSRGAGSPQAGKELLAIAGPLVLNRITRWLMPNVLGIYYVMVTRLCSVIEQASRYMQLTVMPLPLAVLDTTAAMLRRTFQSCAFYYQVPLPQGLGVPEVLWKLFPAQISEFRVLYPTFSSSTVNSWDAMVAGVLEYEGLRYLETPIPSYLRDSQPGTPLAPALDITWSQRCRAPRLVVRVPARTQFR